MHWVSATHAKDAEVRLFDRLFKVEEPGKATGNWVDDLNPNSLEVVHAKIEPAAALLAAGTRIQFERLGYFVMDQDSGPGKPVFNRTVTLKDGWVKEAAKDAAKA
jgi:glutaminyl-tRNA synthetase